MFLMEIAQSVGIALLLLFAFGILYWQKRLWDASDAARYYSKYPPDGMKIRLQYEGLSEPEVDKLVDLEICVVESLGLDMGGGPDHFTSIGMTPKQAEYLKDILEVYFWAINKRVYINCFYYYDREDEEDEDD